jgi:hypothetical protein
VQWLREKWDSWGNDWGRNGTAGAMTEGDMGQLGQWLREKWDGWSQDREIWDSWGNDWERNGTAGAMTEGDMGQLGQWLREKWDGRGNDWGRNGTAGAMTLLSLEKYRELNKGRKKKFFVTATMCILFFYIFKSGLWYATTYNHSIVNSQAFHVIT